MPTPSVTKHSSFKSILSPRAQQNFALANQKTIHSGWLWKLGGWAKTNLQRRWFEIKGDQLYYFRAKGDNTPVGQVPLAGNRVARRPPLDDEAGRYAFQIIAGEERLGRPVLENNDSLCFAAPSPMEVDHWLKAINRVIYTPQGGGMFGRPIIDTIRIDSRKGGGMVPIIVEMCVNLIRETGLETEGIFRVAGFKDEVEELKDSFNRGNLPDLMAGPANVHVVASVLKQYLGELPEPVIPYDCFDQFMGAGNLYRRDPGSALIEIERLLQRIPRAHYNLLKFLCRFLFEVQEQSPRNLMTAENLALVFGPNILGPQNEDPTTLLSSIGVINTLTMAFIKHQSRLFPASADEVFFRPRDGEPCPPVESMSFVFDKEEKVDAEEEGVDRLTATFPRIPVRRHSTSIADRLWNSEGNLVDLADETVPSHDVRGAYDNEAAYSQAFSVEDQVLKLRFELEEQRIHFEEQIRELEAKLGAEIKIREMLKIRLVDEHKARVAAEGRLDLYRTGIEDYCRKFGHTDISIA